MRELKFRLWHKSTKSYIKTCIVDGVEYNEISAFDLVGLRSDSQFQSDVILEPSTGLKDKNGKEIYEGDILGGIWEGGYIAWCDKCKQFQYRISTNECMACLGDVHWHELVEDDGKLEVIGNIHENKE